MARPARAIDWDEVELMAKAGSPGTEIAAIYNMHPDTFYLRVKDEFGIGFSEYFRSRKNNGKALIRAKQYSLALEGNTQLLLRLGETMLDQGKGEEQKASEATVKVINSMDNLNGSGPLPEAIDELSRGDG